MLMGLVHLRSLLGILSLSIAFESSIGASEKYRKGLRGGGHLPLGTVLLSGGCALTFIFVVPLSAERFEAHLGGVHGR